jgi:nicotinamide-nucleotide amidase
MASMTLHAEIISIGDELTSGQRLDTNSQYLSQKLSDLGIRIRYHTTIGDEFADNVEAFRIAAERVDVVIATGGLGPTADDLTREAIGEAFALPLELRPEALAHIESLFALRRRAMPERNRIQAMFPRTSLIIPNPHGTAPGIDLFVPRKSSGGGQGCRIFALPGVPAEMVEMLDASVVPRLIQDLGAGSTRWRYHCLKVFGIGESDVEHRIPDLIARDRVPRVGITVSRATITLRIAAQTASDAEFDALIAPTVQEIRNALGDRVFGEGDVELQQAVDELLQRHSIRLGVIEVGASCRIAHMLGSLQSEGSERLVVSQRLATEAELERWVQSCRPIDLHPTDSKSTESHLENALRTGAESLLHQHQLDRCLAVGVYPTTQQVVAATLMPYTDLTMCLARTGHPTRTSTVSLGGHPDVLYHRLAKTALNFLRLDLLKK